MNFIAKWNLCFRSIQDGVAEYDFSYLDGVLDHLTSIELYPVIEFMGDPSNAFSASKVPRWNDVWERLTMKFMQRYIGEYIQYILQKLQ